MDELESLLANAQAEARRVKKENPQAYLGRAKFTDAANWNLKGQVRLIHRSPSNEETLIGLFDEYIHCQTPSARKLLATRVGGTANPRTEYVTQDHWLGESRLELGRKEPDQTISLCEDLVLEMGVSAPAVLVECRLSGGGIQCVRLQRGTLFEGGTPRQVVDLPAGMDIFEALTKESRKRLWSEIQNAET